jgi:hypothetical protein
VFLASTLLYPYQVPDPPPVPSNQWWKFQCPGKPLDTIETVIGQEIKRTAGRLKVAGIQRTLFLVYIPINIV